MKRIYLILIILTLGISLGYAQSMDWLCHPGEYSEIQYVGGDLFKVRTMQGKWGILHANGEMRVKAIYDSITPFVEDRALLLDRSGKRMLGIIDMSGNIIKDFSSEEIYVSRYPNFREGRISFGNRNGLYGYMNDKGAIVIEPQFYMAAPFQNGIAAVQYDNTDYGLINKSGRSAIVSDEHYSFISSPVEGKVLAVKGSRRGGEQLLIMRLEGTSLKKDKVLEDGMYIWLSDDFTTVECQLGHTYHIDNQWRVESSSHNAKLPQIPEEPMRVITESSTILSKISTEGGMKITYLGNPIMDYAFPDVATFDKSYAVVRSRDGKIGVLKLNPSAAITIKSPATPVIFTHNELKDVILDVELVDVDPAKIKWYRNNQGWLTHSTLEQENGVWKLRMPYFKQSDSYGNEETETVDIAITYDGLDWMHQFIEVKSRHESGYKVSLSGGDRFGENGNATLSLKVEAINGTEGASGTISINGGAPMHFSNGSKTIPLSIYLAEGDSRTFSYTVVIKEDGCPEYSTQVAKSVHNPARKRQNPEKVGIIIE